MKCDIAMKWSYAMLDDWMMICANCDLANCRLNWLELMFKYIGWHCVSKHGVCEIEYSIEIMQCVNVAWAWWSLNLPYCGYARVQIKFIVCTCDHRIPSWCVYAGWCPELSGRRPSSCTLKQALVRKEISVAPHALWSRLETLGRGRFYAGHGVLWAFGPWTFGSDNKLRKKSSSMTRVCMSIRMTHVW